jgi:hypothetical protein
LDNEATHRLAKWHPRRAHESRTRSYIAKYACLPRHLYAITNSEVSTDTDLTSKATPLSHCRGASQANLRSHHSMLTDLTVVSYLNEIVQLDPTTDDRIIHNSSVDTRIGTDLDIILY